MLLPLPIMRSAVETLSSHARQTADHQQLMGLQDGKLVNTITGVNAPVISTTVDKLSAEAAAVATAKA